MLHGSYLLCRVLLQGLFDSTGVQGHLCPEASSWSCRTLSSPLTLPYSRLPHASFKCSAVSNPPSHALQPCYVQLAPVRICMVLYALGDAQLAWVLLLNPELKGKGRFLPSAFSASFRLVGLVREPLGLPDNICTCGNLGAETTGPQVGVGNSKCETLVWESSAETVGLGILPSAPGWFF